MSTTTASEPQVHIERIFNAPRELVFNAFGSEEHLKHWYAPKGCSLQYVKVDFRTGGTFHLCIKSPMGEHWQNCTYADVTLFERIVIDTCASDAAGNKAQTNCGGGDANWPNETTVRIQFEDLGGKTKMTLDQNVSEALAKRTGAYPSWLSQFDNLDAWLAQQSK